MPMLPLLELFGVKLIMISPFGKDFDRAQKLLQCYFAYCLKTINYDELEGQVDDGVELELWILLRYIPVLRMNCMWMLTLPLLLVFSISLKIFLMHLLRVLMNLRRIIQWYFMKSTWMLQTGRSLKNKRLLQHCWWHSKNCKIVTRWKTFLMIFFRSVLALSI